jgi:hypothetical protein
VLCTMYRLACGRPRLSIYTVLAAEAWAEEHDANESAVGSIAGTAGLVFPSAADRPWCRTVYCATMPGYAMQTPTKDQARSPSFQAPSSLAP